MLLVLLNLAACLSVAIHLIEQTEPQCLRLIQRVKLIYFCLYL